jgi:hypothetical protein
MSILAPACAAIVLQANSHQIGTIAWGLAKQGVPHHNMIWALLARTVRLKKEQLSARDTVMVLWAIAKVSDWFSIQYVFERSGRTSFTRMRGYDDTISSMYLMLEGPLCIAPRWTGKRGKLFCTPMSCVWRADSLFA